MLTKLYCEFYAAVYELLHREEGQDLAEYAILLVLIALVVIAAVLFLGTKISSVMKQAGDGLLAT